MPFGKASHTKAVGSLAACLRGCGSAEGLPRGSASVYPERWIPSAPVVVRLMKKTRMDPASLRGSFVLGPVVRLRRCRETAVKRARSALFAGKVLRCADLEQSCGRPPVIVFFRAETRRPRG